MRNLTNIFVSLKLSARWMPGTCLAGYSTVENGNRRASHAIPFYNDIIAVDNISEAVVNVQKYAHDIVSRIRSYLFGCVTLCVQRVQK